jgi:hypothetical protein
MRASPGCVRGIAGPTPDARAEGSRGRNEKSRLKCSNCNMLRDQPKVPCQCCHLGEFRAQPDAHRAVNAASNWGSHEGAVEAMPSCGTFVTRGRHLPGSSYSRLRSRAGPHMLEELLGHDVADAVRRAAAARIVTVVHQIVTVVEGDLFACPDIARCEDPDAAVLQKGIAIGRATVVEQTRRVPCHIPVQVLLVIQAEDILVVLLASAQRLALADPLANVFDDARAFANSQLRESAQSVDWRTLEYQQVRFECIVVHVQVLFGNLMCSGISISGGYRTPAPTRIKLSILAPFCLPFRHPLRVEPLDAPEAEPQRQPNESAHRPSKNAAVL